MSTTRRVVKFGGMDKPRVGLLSAGGLLLLAGAAQAETSVCVDGS